MKSVQRYLVRLPVVDVSTSSSFPFVAPAGRNEIFFEIAFEVR